MLIPEKKIKADMTFSKLKTVFILVFFLSLSLVFTKLASAQCASGWYCLGTRVTDLYTSCNASCNRAPPTRIDPHVCGGNCEAVERYVASCTNNCTTYNNNCGQCNETCGDWYWIWGRCRQASDIPCNSDSGCYGLGPCDGSSLTRDCTCNTCTKCSCDADWKWSSCAPGSTTDCYNCCARDPDPPPDPDPVCDANPGIPNLVNPADGFTTTDTNVVDFSWSANGWGGVDCGNRAFRLQVDDNNNWADGNIYDSGNLSESTTSRSVTFNRNEGGPLQWRVGAQNENDGFQWSPTRNFSLYYIPPTAELRSPANNTTIGVNTTQSFQANAIDAVGPMTRMNLERARVTMFGLVDLTELDQPGGNSDEACSGVTCQIVREWTPGPGDVGQWIVYMKAFDILEAYDGSCTGSPIIPVGWADCGRTGLQDFINVVVDNTPPVVSSITGPSQLRLGGSPGYTTSEYTGLFNLVYSDANKQEVTTTWSATSPMTLETINTIRVNVDSVVDGAVPEMKVVIGDPLNNGVRYEACTNAINVAQTVSCPIGDKAATSIDIYFTNKVAGSNMALIVDNIEIVYTDGSTRIIEAESNDVACASNCDVVIYDRAITASDPQASPYDGVDTMTGRERMDWKGSLRFPIPISFTPVAPTTQVILTGAAKDSSGVTTSANKTINVCGAPPSGGLNNPSPAVDAQDVPRPVTLEWDGPADWGNTCASGSNDYTVYYRTKINPSCVAPNPNGVGGYTNYSPVANCTDIADTGGRQSCLDTTNAFDRNTDYCWFVEANNGELTNSSFQTTGIVWNFETEDPLDDKDWFTTIGGDLYAGGIAGGAGNPLELPNVADYHVTWTPPYLASEDGSGLPVSSLSSLDMDISSDNPNQGTTYFPESQSGLYAENASLTSTWPDNFTGNPPSDAISLPRSGESCDDIFIHAASRSSPALRPTESYKADVSCVQDGIDNYGGDYRNQNPGVATIYVTGTGELRFTGDFVTNNDNYRVVFVTGPNVDVKIDRTLTDPVNPDPINKANLTPLIEAAFVVTGTFEFEGTPNDPLDDPDTSVVVEGPIIGKVISLNRDRGLTNYFPSEIIKYNNDYLYNLTQAERALGNAMNNFTGLFVVDVDWISED